jgi:hypothetical protein
MIRQSAYEAKHPELSLYLYRSQPVSTCGFDVRTSSLAFWRYPHLISFSCLVLQPRKIFQRVLVLKCTDDRVGLGFVKFGMDIHDWDVLIIWESSATTGDGRSTESSEKIWMIFSAQFIQREVKCLKFSNPSADFREHKTTAGEHAHKITIVDKCLGTPTQATSILHHPIRSYFRLHSSFLSSVPLVLKWASSG